MNYRQLAIDAILNRGTFDRDVLGLIESGQIRIAEDLAAVEFNEQISDADLFRLAFVLFHADVMGA